MDVLKLQERPTSTDLAVFIYVSGSYNYILSNVVAKHAVAVYIQLCHIMMIM